jgi:hypothetical protein
MTQPHKLMNRASYPTLWLAVAALACAVISAIPAHAQSGEQIVTLSAGWNAIWLEVEPLNTTGPNIGAPKAPQDVFTNPAIQVIATPKPLAGLAEFFGDEPGTIGTFNQDEWQQWKRTDPTGSNNLPMVFGNRPYLIQVAAGTTTFGLTISGKVRFFRPTWTPDRYNLVGFGLDGARTFDQFFGASGGKHPVAKIFRLNVSGSWEHVTGGAAMASNHAYWVFSAGPSRYMGPVSVDFDNAVTGRLSFGGPIDAVPTGTGIDLIELDLEELIFTNLGTSPATPELDLIAADPGAGSLALHAVSPASNSLSYVRGNQIDSSPGAGASAALGETIASLKTAALSIGAKRNWTTGSPERTNLYRLKTGGGGASFWLPIHAFNSDILLPVDLTPGSPTSAVTGLWVGEVIVNAATSIVEAGAPIRPSAGSVPMRILLHSDTAGAVRLLSQVTIMQTRSADPAVAPVPVLVVDQARIPFFEGIKERNGRRVGVRLEAVAYDMPRDSSVAAQSTGGGDLIDMIVAESTSPATKWLSGAGLYPNRASVTQVAINSFLLFRSIRPPALKEVYQKSLAATGAIGSGKTVRTSTGALSLDPFHRSNPFRHAYHQNHPKGPNITRTFEFVFDPDQSIPDRLRGTFRETIQGVVKSNLELTGRVEMRRVSAVATLDGQ